ncbi:hypothetical protein T09_12157 [Trichinella sp. T9]|nr:hypothetical protein T09_12157 [Trichinella sp. T9]
MKENRVAQNKEILNNSAILKFNHSGSVSTEFQ